MSTIVCDSCGNESPIQFRYCGYCGALLPSNDIDKPSARPPVDNQNSRRVVTLLFADLTNYTRTASRVDPEMVYITVRELFERLARSVRRQGGYIDRYVGDGFLAAFGLPEAHEDDPARALRSAMEMQQIVADLRAKASQNLDWEWELRVGVNSGPVIRGQIDTGSLVDSSVFGHAVNLANRLQEAARPSTILVSESIYKRTRSLFDFSEPVRLYLRGIDRTVIGYELVGQRADPQPSRGLTGRRTELVGRQAEFDTLSSAVQRLKVERTGMITLVSGPAGIGKTRLVEDVLAQIAGFFTIIRTGCSPTEVTSYALLTSILENLAGILPDDPSPVRQQRVDELLSSAGVMAQEIVPTLHYLVGAPSSAKQPTDDPQQQQRGILAAVRRLFAWMVRRQALVLVLDDLQWADPSSLNALVHISDLVTEAPLALVAIARSPARTQLLSTLNKPHLARPDSFYDIQLQPLSQEESELLVTLLLKTVSLPNELKQNIVDRGGGNPLVIEELVRMLLDQQVIQQTPTGWQIEDRWAEVVQQVPDTVNGLILGRYDRLPADLKQVLIQAAVLGPSFSLPLLAVMAGSNEIELRELLKRLEEADFLRRSAGAGLPIYFFRHAIMQEAIYGTLLHGASKVLHQRAANAIQQMADDLAVNSAALIGHHLEKANSPEAFRFLMQAAGQAADRYANQEAITCYKRAEAQLTSDQKEQGVDVALGLAEVLARVNQLDQARETLERARALSESAPLPNYRLGDIRYLMGRVHAMLGDHAGAAGLFELAAGSLTGRSDSSRTFSNSDIEREVGWVMCRQGKLAQARAHAERALSLALDKSDKRAVASAYNLLTPVHYWAGRLPEAVKSAREALSIREQIGDIWGSASTQTNLAGLYHRLGHWEQAESLLRQAVFVRQEIGDHQGVVLSSNTLALLLLESGRFDEAMDWLEQALSALQKGEVSPDLASQLYGNQGLLWLRMNKPELALLNLEKCLSFAEQSGNDDLQALALVYLSEAHLSGGNPTLAQELLQTSAALAECGSPEVRAEYLRVRSLLLKTECKWTEALDANRQALALNQELGNRYEVAHLQLETARIWLACCQQIPKTALDISVRTNVLDALKILQVLPAQALIPQAEELLSKINARIQETGLEPAEGEQQYILVRIGYHLPAGMDDRADVVAGAVEQLQDELENLGQKEGAVVAPCQTGLVLLFSDQSSGSTERLVLNAVNFARAALDVAIRLNRASQRLHDLVIPVIIGVVAGNWKGSIHKPEEVNRFASESAAGSQSGALIELPLKDIILLAGIVANIAQQTFELDPLEFKVLTEQVYCLGRARSEIAMPLALPGSATRLIGREAEIGALKSGIDRIRTGSHGLVFYMEARAGMGKTRLVEEITAYARPDITCMMGKCESFRANISYWPLIDMLEQSRLPDTDAGRQLKSLLALRPLDEADEALLNNISPADLRRELFRRLKAFLLENAAKQPLLLVVEDIHCIDLSSLDLIDYLLPLTFQAPISIMLVARAEMPGPHRALISRIERVCRDTYLRISFSSLSEVESTTLIQNLLEASRMPDQLWPLIQPFAGHPLSLEEALRFLVERRWLWRSNGRWHVTITDERPGHSLPRTFGDLVLGRLDALDKETLHIFQAAAVLGENFDRTVLNRIVPHPNLSRRLAELVERGWLIEPPPGQPNLFRFKHTLTRETVYATMLTSKRQLIHQRAAEAIRALYPEAESEHLELLAYHFAQSALREESLHYLVRAAEKSAAQFALAESLGYYTRAEKLLALLPAMRQRLLPRIVLGLADVHLSRGEPASASARVAPLLDDAELDLSAEMKAALLRRLAESRREMGEYGAALKLYENALAMLKRASRGDQAVDFEQESIEVGIAQTYLNMRENKLARDKVEGVLLNIDQKAHARLAAEALNILGGVAYRQKDLATSAEMVRQSLSINQAIGNRNGAASDYSNLGILAAASQDADSARYYSSLSLEVYEELGDSRGIAITLNNFGQLERNRGNFSIAIKYLERGARAARQSELTQVLAQSLANLGPALLCNGQTAEAMSTLDEAESLCERYRFRNLLCEVRWKKADALVENLDLPGAEKAAQAALLLANELGSHDLKSEAQRTLARIYRKTKRPALALDEALAAWQARANDESPLIQARFAAEYALTLLENGQNDRAQHILKSKVARAVLYEPPSAMEEIANALSILGKARPPNGKAG